MGNCLGSPPTSSKELKLKQNKLKLILLGAGESGKSTMFKQVKFKYSEGYTSKEKKELAVTVRSNVLTSLQSLISATTKFKLKVAPENEDFATLVNSWKPTEFSLYTDNENWTPKFSEKIERLWKDEAIQTVLGQRSKFQLLDSTEYYLNNLERISQADYSPSDEDILRCRVKTTGIVNVTFEENGYIFQLCDVGGQRNERRKWIHVFDDVNAILFVVSLSEYDLTCYEDGTTPRMDESLQLFTNICENKLFDKTPIILIFNKNDLFTEKIQSVDVSLWKKEYEGGCDYDKGIKFIRDKFLEANVVENRKIEFFVTTSTDQNIFFPIFDQIKGSIVNL
eukprot:gene12828-7179_t